MEGGVPPPPPRLAKNEAHIGGILGVCKVNMSGGGGGGEEGVQSEILNKNRSTYFFLKKIMSNSSF